MSITNEQLMEWAKSKYDKAVSEGKDNNGLVKIVDYIIGGGIDVDLILRENEEPEVAVYVYNHPTQFTTYFGLNSSPEIFYQILKFGYAMEEVFGDE